MGPAASGQPATSPIRPIPDGVSLPFCSIHARSHWPEHFMPAPLRRALSFSRTSPDIDQRDLCCPLQTSCRLYRYDPARCQLGGGRPACRQVVLKLPWSYGPLPQETQDIPIYLRVNAYTSSLCVEIPTRVFRIGDIASGFADQCSAEYDSEQLAGRGEVPPHLRHSTPPTTYPSQFALHTSAAFLLPQLAGGDMPI